MLQSQYKPIQQQSVKEPSPELFKILNYFILIVFNLLFFIIYAVTIVNPSLIHIIYFVILNYFYVLPINAIMKYTDNQLSFKEMARIFGLILNKQLLTGFILIITGLLLGVIYHFLVYLFSNNTASFLMFIPFLLIIYFNASFLVKFFQTPILVILEISEITDNNKLIIIAFLNMIILTFSMFYLIFFQELLSKHLMDNIIYFAFFLATFYSGYFGIFGADLETKRNEIHNIIKGIKICH